LDPVSLMINLHSGAHACCSVLQQMTAGHLTFS